MHYALPPLSSSIPTLRAIPPFRVIIARAIAQLVIIALVHINCPSYYILKLCLLEEKKSYYA